MEQYRDVRHQQNLGELYSLHSAINILKLTMRLASRRHPIMVTEWWQSITPIMVCYYWQHCNRCWALSRSFNTYSHGLWKQFANEIQWKLWPSILHQWSVSMLYKKKIIWLGFTSTSTFKLNSLNEMCVPDVGAFLLQGENETRIYNRNLQKLHVELWAKKNWLIFLQLVSIKLHHYLILWSCWIENYMDWMPRA